MFPPLHQLAPLHAARLEALLSSQPAAFEPATGLRRLFGGKQALSPAFLDHWDAVLEADQGFVDAMHQSGFLSVAPRIVRGDDIDQGPAAALYAHGDGKVGMAPPGEDGSNLLAPNASLSQRRMARWMVLLHEVSHCALAARPISFTPSHPQDPKAVAAIEQGLLSPVAASKFPAQLFHENYADAMSAMLLLEIEQHSPGAVGLVKSNARQRLLARQKSHRHVVEDGGDMVPHLTEGALQQVLDTASKWKGKGFEELHQAALRIASDGFVREFSDAHVAASGFCVGHMLRNLHMRPGICLRRLADVCADADAAPSFDRVRANMAGHPLEAQATQLIDWLAKPNPELSGFAPWQALHGHLPASSPGRVARIAPNLLDQKIEGVMRGVDIQAYAQSVSSGLGSLVFPAQLAQEVADRLSRRRAGEVSPVSVQSPHWKGPA